MSNDLNLTMDLSDDEKAYLDSSAALRCTSRAAMLRGLLHVVLREQMILSVLDDDNKPSSLTRNKPRGPAPRVNSPVPKIWAAGVRKRTPLTGSQQRDELRQAIENTQALTPPQEDADA